MRDLTQNSKGRVGRSLTDSPLSDFEKLNLFYYLIKHGASLKIKWPLLIEMFIVITIAKYFP